MHFLATSATQSLSLPYGCVSTGHVTEIMGDKGPWAFVRWTEAYGPIFKLQFLDSFGVVLTDPNTIARVTRKTGEGMAKGLLIVARPGWHCGGYPQKTQQPCLHALNAS
jgi:hypothetical protein